MASAKVAGPLLHVGRKLLKKAGRREDALPDPVTPGLLGLWDRHLFLDSQAATRQLQLDWTPYPAALQEAAAAASQRKVAEEAAEPLRGGLGEADVLVLVERGDAGPVDARGADEGVHRPFDAGC